MIILIFWIYEVLMFENGQNVCEVGHKFDDENQSIEIVVGLNGLA